MQKFLDICGASNKFKVSVKGLQCMCRGFVSLAVNKGTEFSDKETVSKCSVLLWNVLGTVEPRLYDPLSHNLPTPTVWIEDTKKK